MYKKQRKNQHCTLCVYSVNVHPMGTTPGENESILPATVFLKPILEHNWTSVYISMPLTVEETKKPNILALPTVR